MQFCCIHKSIFRFPNQRASHGYLQYEISLSFTPKLCKGFCLHTFFFLHPSLFLIRKDRGFQNPSSKEKWQRQSPKTEDWCPERQQTVTAVLNHTVPRSDTGLVFSFFLIFNMFFPEQIEKALAAWTILIPFHVLSSLTNMWNVYNLLNSGLSPTQQLLFLI